MKRNTSALWLIPAAMLVAGEARACTVSAITSNSELIRDADAVVRAQAVEYVRRPDDPAIRTTGVPDSRVRFVVLEEVRGENVNDVVLPGYLVSTDDFNDQQPPYKFVRPGGRAGSCFANSYRRDAQYLLFLKKEKRGGFTVNWAPLAPVNEQLHSESDPWLVWVRGGAQMAAAPSR